MFRALLPRTFTFAAERGIIADMTMEQLRNVHQTRPFQPFTLHLADGRQLAVPHREFLSHSPTGRTVIVHESDDSFSIVDLLLVTRLQVHTGNGSPRADEKTSGK